MRRSWGLFLVLVIAVPLIPFLVIGELPGVEWLHTASGGFIFGLGILLLAADIILPLPSSLIAVFLGAQLGFGAGAVAVFLGLMTGSLIGYAIGRYLGRPVLDRLTSTHAQEMYQTIEHRFSYWALAVTRSVPLLAEASVLAAGVATLSLRRTIPVLCISNAGLALLYSAFGSLGAKQSSAMPLFVGGIIIPALGVLLLLVIFGKSFFQRSSADSI